jgi:hypothetical protein
LTAGRNFLYKYFIVILQLTEIEMTASNIAPLADAYALLKFEQEKITARVDAARKELLDAAGDDAEVYGDACIVAIDVKAGARSLDKDAALNLLRQLGATEDQIAALTKVGKPTKALRVKPLLANVA